MLIFLMVLMGFTGMRMSHTHKMVQFKHMWLILCQVYLNKVLTVKTFHEKEIACLVYTALATTLILYPNWVQNSMVFVLPPASPLQFCAANSLDSG